MFARLKDDIRQAKKVMGTSKLGRGLAQNGYEAPLSVNLPAIRAQAWEEGLISSSSNYISLESLNREEEEKAVIQLVLNKRQNPMICAVEIGVSASLISILSSENDEHSNDLAYAPLQPG
ncbi:hypothetical protein Acr_18g0009260 [Actinidia rufa]|uniref:Uncharacterized protein n=1 Tax=Actinidia rufa TaxID=165716 RepID=A0A7J0G7I1_9ERIC|nr:hypothetical protein Acr_18g0009260 [Actinidia rufa]